MNRRKGDFSWRRLGEIFTCPGCIGVIILAYGLAFAYHGKTMQKPKVPEGCKLYYFDKQDRHVIWCPRRIKGV